MNVAPFPYVVFSGNVGVGKTTVARLFAERKGFECATEPVERLTFVNEFFADMPRWSFHHQLDFLSLKADQERAILLGSHATCQDRSLDECFGVFTRLFYEQGWISEKEWVVLTRLYRLLADNAPRPDLLVFLTAPLNVLMERIARRSRSHEKTVKVEWLKQLDAAYARWIAEIDVPVVHIDTGACDVVASQMHRNGAIDLISDSVANIRR